MWMEEILHKLVDGLSRYNPIIVPVFHRNPNKHPKWCRIPPSTVFKQDSHDYCQLLLCISTIINTNSIIINIAI